MKTYNVPGTAVTWTAQSGASAQTVQTFEFARNVQNQFKMVLPVTLTTEATTSRQGLRRVLIKCATQVNGKVLRENATAGVTPGGDALPISCHVVITAPEALAQQYASEGTVRGVRQVLEFELRSILAILLDKDVGIPEDAVVVDNSAIETGLVGGLPVDAVSGEYGVDTAPESD